MNGVKAVARAWGDADFRTRLLKDGTAALDELGLDSDENFVAVANEPGVHNVVVCTLCSCYPWGILGLPPAWYKEPPYRARMVREPRVLLKEMGCDVPDDTEVRVLDSSAEVRYLVVPERPAGTGGCPKPTRGARHAGLDDRRGAAVKADLFDVEGAAAPPRRNGELVFEAPWQSRVFGLCAAIVETCFNGDREPFRQHLIAAIAAEPDRPYWDSWTVALQQLVLDAGLVDQLELDQRIESTADGEPPAS